MFALTDHYTHQPVKWNRCHMADNQTIEVCVSICNLTFDLFADLLTVWLVLVS